ncbi:MAG: cupin domain-containing protein, partial [Elusimicrobia bacterium]|nr:cupin domain-containing protein [Elusimicrobiota bacterium]
YIIEGKGVMHINDGSQEVSAGMAVYIPPHGVQYIHNNGTHDLIFICLVDPAWRKEYEEVF